MGDNTTTTTKTTLRGCAAARMAAQSNKNSWFCPIITKFGQNDWSIGVIAQIPAQSEQNCNFWASSFIYYSVSHMYPDAAEDMKYWWCCCMYMYSTKNVGGANGCILSRGGYITKKCKTMPSHIKKLCPNIFQISYY